MEPNNALQVPEAALFRGMPLSRVRGPGTESLGRGGFARLSEIVVFGIRRGDHIGHAFSTSIFSATSRYTAAHASAISAGISEPFPLSSASVVMEQTAVANDVDL